MCYPPPPVALVLPPSPCTKTSLMCLCRLSPCPQEAHYMLPFARGSMSSRARPNLPPPPPLRRRLLPPLPFGNDARWTNRARRPRHRCRICAQAPRHVRHEAIGTERGSDGMRRGLAVDAEYDSVYIHVYMLSAVLYIRPLLISATGIGDGAPAGALVMTNKLLPY